MTEALGRRERIGRGVMGAGALAAALPAPAGARAMAGSFTSLHHTDIHTEPQKHAAPAPAFALRGGDLVFDANAVPCAHAAHPYDLSQEQAGRMGLPVHYCLGNHDLFALGPVQSTHIAEEVSSPGTRDISAGAVCGDWWKGRRLGIYPADFHRLHRPRERRLRLALRPLRMESGQGRLT